MSTSLAAVSASRPDGHRWFNQRLREITRRARLFARRLPRGERDEAVAEILAMVFQYVLGADARSKLDVLTVPTLVRFYFRAFVDGRRAAGANGRDVFSPRVHRRHGVSVVSLDQPRRMHRAGLHWPTLLGAGRCPVVVIGDHHAGERLGRV